MDFSVFPSTLLQASSPALPDALAMRLALHGVWAIALASAAMLLATRLARPYRLGLVLVVLIWTLLPGELSPAYWLALAFQTPSLMSAVLCLYWLVPRVWSAPVAAVHAPQLQHAGLRILAVLGVVLGWVLLLDTFAAWQVSVYAWGFGSSAFVAVTLIAALLWLALGSTASTLALLVLALFALTRLPTGNVWDALLDPWLWLALQLGWLIKAALRWRARRRGPAAIRA